VDDVAVALEGRRGSTNKHTKSVSLGLQGS
jgi:hypothetical protein